MTKLVVEKPKVLWLQSITCNGNTHSFLNYPEFETLSQKIEWVYHPVLETGYTFEEVLNKQAPCDILILEGAVIEQGFCKEGVEVFELIGHYAKLAKHTICVGTCASFGGVFKAKDPSCISGLAYNGNTQIERYQAFEKKLINLPGCPIHPEWLGFTLQMLLSGDKIALDGLHRPRELYGYTVHNGCLRNEYFEWKVDSKNFGHKEGCLFYEQGCQGPYTRGSCNKTLWHTVSSKTRVGTPCFGCTEPTFPMEKLFSTKTNMGLPAKRPLGISQRAYFTATGIAKGFKIARLNSPLLEYDDENT